jgi:hypothetical protein
MKMKQENFITLKIIVSLSFGKLSYTDFIIQNFTPLNPRTFVG